jgi:GNAT superfamily N-acetyltransferase
MIREIREGEVFTPPAPPATIRAAKPDEAKLYTKVVTDGFAEQVPVTQSLRDVVESFFHRPQGQSFLAFLDGEVAGAAAVAAQDGIAELYGAATLPRFRGRGVQTALIAQRLAWGAEQGCSLATTTTGPATTSQRNFERAGFQIVYSRTKLVRACLSEGRL